MGKTAIIRKIEEKDKGNYLRLFNEESLGCISILEEMKPSLWEEEKYVSGIIDNKNIDSQILVVEDNGEFIGYAAIQRATKNMYHIGEFVIKENKRGKGYGKKLLDTIKESAACDRCDITLECLTSARLFFEKQGFKNIGSVNYRYQSKKKMINKTSNLFVDYANIEESRKQEQEKERESFKKFLKSPLCKSLRDML